MTWTSFHRRGETLRAVVAVTDARRDGRLPLELPGAADVFDGELDLLAALLMKWHTRLAGRIEHELAHQPVDLEAAVVTAWRRTADELPGIRAVIDHHRAHPADGAMAEALARSLGKERELLAAASGRGNAHDPASTAVGARIEQRAASGHRASASSGGRNRATLLERLRAGMVA